MLMANKKPTPSAAAPAAAALSTPANTNAPAPPETPASTDAPQAQQAAPALVLMVRAPGKEKGYPPRCLVHPAEVAHMQLYDWIVAPDAD